MRKTLIAVAAALGAAGALAAENLLITGAGATFPFPLYSKWFSDYNKKNPSLRFNYQSIGSGGGIKQITEKTVDFGATDSAMTDAELARAPGIIHVPMVLGSVVPIYDIPGVSQRLRFTGDILAGIFLGQITSWNDSRIAAVNPGVALPKQDIVVVHRSDGSGTTYIWTDYLAKVSREWARRVGHATSVSWPVGLGGHPVFGCLWAYGPVWSDDTIETRRDGQCPERYEQEGQLRQPSPRSATGRHHANAGRQIEPHQPRKPGGDARNPRL